MCCSLRSQYDTQTSSTGYGTTFDPFTENKRETPEKDEEAEALKEQEAGFQVLRATPIERLFENVKEMEVSSVPTLVQHLCNTCVGLTPRALLWLAL